MLAKQPKRQHDTVFLAFFQHDIQTIPTVRASRIKPSMNLVSLK